MCKYKGFHELFLNERENIDYSIELKEGYQNILIAAPHGGGIELGTTEIAFEIAGDNLWLYSFNGLKPLNNKILHIKSISYDEPKLQSSLKNMMTNIIIHGSKYDEPFIYIGGKYKFLKNQLIDNFKSNGIPIKYDDPLYKNLDGISENNITNINKKNEGVQLEFSKGIRMKMFDDYTTKIGRERKNELFWNIVWNIRKSIEPLLFTKL